MFGGDPDMNDPTTPLSHAEAAVRATQEVPSALDIWVAPSPDMWRWTDWPLLDLFARGALLFVVAMALSWAWGAFVRRLWWLGQDRRYSLAYTVAPVRSLIALMLTFGILGPLHSDNPTAALSIGATVMLAAMTWGYGLSRSAVSGLFISITQPFRVGDSVLTSTGLHGRVVWLGLTSVSLRTTAGGAVSVPCCELGGQRLRVASREREAFPVELTVGLPAGVAGAAAAQAVRDQVLLSSYTDAAAPVLVELLDGGQVRVCATPTRGDELEALRSDLVARVTSLTV